MGMRSCRTLVRLANHGIWCSCGSSCCNDMSHQIHTYLVSSLQLRITNLCPAYDGGGAKRTSPADARVASAVFAAVSCRPPARGVSGLFRPLRTRSIEVETVRLRRCWLWMLCVGAQSVAWCGTGCAGSLQRRFGRLQERLCRHCPHHAFRTVCVCMVVLKLCAVGLLCVKVALWCSCCCCTVWLRAFVSNRTLIETLLFFLFSCCFHARVSMYNHAALCGAPFGLVCVDPLALALWCRHSWAPWPLNLRPQIGSSKVPCPWTSSTLV